MRPHKAASLCLALLFACSPLLAAPRPAAPAPRYAKPEPVALTKDGRRWAAQVLKKLTLEEKIGSGSVFY